MFTNGGGGHPAVHKDVGVVAKGNGPKKKNMIRNLYPGFKRKLVLFFGKPSGGE